MITEYFFSSQFNLVVIMENSNVGTVCCEDGCSKRILELEQKFASMQRYIKEKGVSKTHNPPQTPQIPTDLQKDTL